MGWKPDNWKELDKDERKALRKEHRQATWGKIKAAIDPLIREAAVMAGTVGDERHDWVVDNVLEAADKLATAPGPWGIAIEIASDKFIYSDFFRGLVDGWVHDAFDRLKAAGDLD